MMQLSFLVLLSTLVFSVLGRQLVFVEENWPLATEFAIRDDIQSYYENIVDEVLSTYSEVLLLEMQYNSYRHGKRTPYFQEQATLIGLSHANEKCVLKLPAYVGQHLYEMNNHVFSQVEPIVDGFIATLWPTHIDIKPGEPLPENEVASFVHSLNEAVTFHILKTIRDYDITAHVMHAMKQCDVIKSATDDSHSSCRHSRWINYLKSLIPSSSRLGAYFSPPPTSMPSSQKPALTTYLETVATELRQGFDNELESLTDKIQQDLIEEYES
ncbi:uncharacterized protein BYT42DRAFT_617105 [Radiomyces spectabilis]|uniref:uncharacterized protein n=1 Tax=Radiomyces spectabilis TaxID=64574 RepID=UPI00221F88D4|nr:uncharacterized protein BYT42DRAFT_617105 [Radiomyces spectabilis]KAI8370562.1 hypothetical protein BYT42DRAFT_617105 [Radiomyces spectabilis]